MIIGYKETDKPDCKGILKVDLNPDPDLQKKRISDLQKKQTLYLDSPYGLKTHF